LKHFPDSVNRDVCIEAMTNFQFFFDSGSGERFQASRMRAIDFSHKFIVRKIIFRQ
jgi:hypothetical protein